jgi:phage-related protein
MWKLLQYRGIVDAMLDSEAKDLESVEARLDILEERGNLCRRPVSAHLGDGIFELRGTGPTRPLFYFRGNRKVVFVHAIQKKTRKVDRFDIETAIRRRKIIEEGKADVTTVAR